LTCGCAVSDEVLRKYSERQVRVPKAIYSQENEIVLKGRIMSSGRSSIEIIQSADIAPSGVDMLVNSPWI
jgi:hypothetical protein